MRELQERHQKKEEAYAKEIQQGKEQLRALVNASQEDEVTLRRKKKRQETDVEELIQK